MVRLDTHTASEHPAVRWDEVEETRNAQAYRPFGKRPLERPRRRRKDNSVTCSRFQTFAVF